MKQNKTFAIIGATGYIAPRHLKAINAVGGTLTAACDIVTPDDMGAFGDASFFTDFDAFCDFVTKNPVDYIAICSPNHLHKDHIMAALGLGADVICEKPLVPAPLDLDDLADAEARTGQRVWNILQLRYHDAIKALRAQIDTAHKTDKHDIEITYITSRDEAYMKSWKGDPERSFGIMTNIGIHFFDMVYYLFGNQVDNILYHAEPMKASGYLEHDHARVTWFLSIDPDDLPADAGATYRSVTCDGQTVDFSVGFTDLHTESYREILNGNGFSIGETRPCIETTHAIRTAKPHDRADHPAHPFYKKMAA